MAVKKEKVTETESTVETEITAEAETVAAPGLDFTMKPAEAFEKASAWSRERLEAAGKSYSDMRDFSKETVDDMMASGKAAATGMRSLSEVMNSMVKAATTEHVETLRKLWTVKSIGDAVAVHSAYTKTALDLLLAHSTRINEAAAQAVIETVEPINSRLVAVSAKVEQMRPAA